MEPAGRWVFIFDNDGFGIPKNSDRNYTMGMSITRMQQGLPARDGVPRSLLQGMGWFNQWAGLKREGQKDAPTWLTFSGTNYTPHDLKAVDPIQGDRPYASLLSLGVGYVQPKGDYLVESEFQLGLLGIDVGEEVQIAIHERCCKNRIPAGWENQIGDGGSPTFLYSMRFGKELTDGKASIGSFPYELRAAAGGEVGWFTRALGRFTFAVGGSKADLDVLRVGVITGGHRPFRLDDIGLLSKQRTSTTGFAFWTSYEVSAFAYNQLLQGAWFGSNPVTLSRDEIETVVHYISAGLELTFLLRPLGLLKGGDSHLYLTQYWRSRDIKTTFGKDQYYGGFTFVWPYF